MQAKELLGNQMRKAEAKTRLLDPIIRVSELANDLGIHPSTLWRWVKAKRFPEPIRYGVRAVGWRRSTVETWVEEHATNR